MKKDTLYLLPGLLCDSDSWRDVADRLAPDYDVVATDLFQQDSLEGMARWVLSVAPERFSVAGHSMGGRVAMLLMRIAPERVERLALVDTAYQPARPEEPANRQVLIDAAHERGMEALVEAWLPPMVGARVSRQPEAMERMADMVRRSTPETFERQQRAIMNRPEIWSVFETIACPTAVICGREDGWSPVKGHEEMAAEIPGAVLTIIEDCGHMAPVESPDAVAGALRDLMRRDA